MKTEEFISALSNIKMDDQARFERLRAGLPLGVDEAGEIVLARTDSKNGRANHLCVTGSQRGEFIKRLLLTLFRLYGKTELSVLLLSPDAAYSDLLTLKIADITAPYVRSQADLDAALLSINELVRMREENGAQKYPRLFVVLDGLEEIVKDENGLLDAYKPFLEKTLGTGVEVITGVDLLKSIFSGYPGAFVGIGNCLVTADGEGKTDVTFVGEDSSLSLPTSLDYPCEPSVEELVAAWNGAEN
ncbi:MAG: hypothetical protein IJ506_00255 [Clostridia bacterium]|nr:hypothetical protein [Clostridia bacterium]